MAALGFAVLAAVALTRVQDQGGLIARVRPEPRIAPPPAGSQVLAASDAEAHLVAALERQVSSLSTELAGLNTALEAMSPLPEQTEFFIPLDPASISGLRYEKSGVSPLVDLYLSQVTEAEADTLLTGWSPNALGIEAGPALHA
jgi:hypothetical protein